jgi:prepilin-type processing-associated H-X9-DG protein
MTETTLPARTSLLAWVSLALGLLSPCSFGASGLPALFLGFLALRQINFSDGRVSGRRAAVAGMALGGLGVAFFVVGLGVVALYQYRLTSERASCQNNLRRVGKAVILYGNEHRYFPPGTVIVEGLPPEKRLSWIVSILPYAEGGPVGPRGAELFERIDCKKPWDAEENRAAVDTGLPWCVCPADRYRREPGTPGVTSYLGIAGVGPGAAALPKDDPRAGFFGYDRVINRDDQALDETAVVATVATAVTGAGGPFAVAAAVVTPSLSPRFGRGLGATMIVAESATANGPWAAGGPSTVRPVGEGPPPDIGPGRPFGGLHPNGVNVLFADGRVTFLGADIDPRVWQAHARINADE